MTTQQMQALGRVCQAILETIRCSPDGAPGGHLYAALMAHGCTLIQFESIMAGLVQAGAITKRGECYHATTQEATR